MTDENFVDFLMRVAPELSEDQKYLIVSRFLENLGAALADAYDEAYTDGKEAGYNVGYEDGAIQGYENAKESFG
jgi:hypothetical protein